MKYHLQRFYVWEAIKELELVPPSKLFDIIKEDDYVVICDLAHNILFRSINLFHYSSYSLEDIYSTPWPGLFEFENNAQVTFLQKLKFPKVGYVSNLHFRIKEKASKRYMFDCTLKATVALAKGRRYAGYIVILKSISKV